MLLLTGVAVVTRFYHLGDWAMTGDEGFTLAFSTVSFTWADLRPLIFAANRYVTIPLFGETTFALRLTSAVAGVVAVPLFSWAVARDYGRRAGLFTGALIVLSPALLTHGQMARYYMQSCLLGGVVVFSVRFAFAGRRRWWIIAGTALILGWFTVPTTAFVLPGLALWIWVERRTLLGARRVPPLLIFGLALAAATLGWWVRDRYTTGPAHGIRYFDLIRLPVQIMALFSVPATLIYGVGLVAAWTDDQRPRIDRTFLPLVALGSGGALLAVYPVIGVAPSHFVSVMIPAIAAGGVLLARLSQLLPSALGTAICALLLLSPAREVGSHYVDGGRTDYQTAAAYLRAHAQTSDRIYAIAYLNLQFHAPIFTVEELNPATRPEPGPPTWLIVTEHRLGPDLPPDSPAGQWLRAYCTFETRISRPRFDHRINAVRIYACGPRQN